MPARLEPPELEVLYTDCPELTDAELHESVYTWTRLRPNAEFRFFQPTFTPILSPPVTDVFGDRAKVTMTDTGGVVVEAVVTLVVFAVEVVVETRHVGQMEFEATVVVTLVVFTVEVVEDRKTSTPVTVAVAERDAKPLESFTYTQ